MLPTLLPWLAALLLLAWRPNRTAGAWWILLPLGVVAALALGAPALLETLPSELVALLAQSYTSLAFGLAAVWLLAPVLRHPHRFAVFVKILLVCAAMTTFAFLVRAGQEEGLGAVAFLMLVGACVLVTVAALSLSGCVARQRFRPACLALWLAIFILGLWLIISLPFLALAAASNGIELWREFGTVVLTLAAVTFATLLPFLLLAYASDFYRERLKQLLHLESVAAPPVIASPPATTPVNELTEGTTV